ncbi:hypothetical protein IE81DRAFT_350781 [Ceraceosorus guamensis]|uniref:Transcription factor domain-containing protein n=1 Tax=Ceraceosorus guamensis TaxID=1522189 RepID=A0A316VRE5_9BASI|nr:hypothetical protein IE81DRAFT_350781 [Ceraceosorus guamensis]PWN38751.1 hypothetical protein IE81DRAFT_350781 [Ceraceosorus guamensis]
MADPPTQRAEELEIRLWWHLVSRDWMASFHRQSYSIHPQHFNARLPDVTDTQTNDPLVGFVPLYIGLAKLARQFFDARLHSASDRAASAASVAEVCRFMDALPSQYSLAADAARLRLEMGDFEAGRLQVHRWMLHQQVFHLCLRTSKLRFGEKVPRHLRVFGSHVLELQDEIRGICPVIDNLRMNVTSVASACTVLMLDLIASSTAQVTSMERQLTLSKVRLAVQQCQSADEGDENGPMGPITCLIRTEELLWSHKIASDSMLPGIELDEESAAVREGGGQVNNAHRTPPVSQTQGLGAPWVSFDGCLPRAVSPMQRGMSVATSPSPSFLPSDFGISPLFSAGPTWADLEPWLADVLQTTETQGLAAALSVSAHMAPET